MLKFISKLLITLTIILGCVYFFKEEISPKILTKETKGTTTYEIHNYNEFYNAIKFSIKNVEPSINIIFKNDYLKNDKKTVLATADKLIKTLGPGSYIKEYSITHNKSNMYEFYTVKYKYEKDIKEIKKQSEEVDRLSEKAVKKITKPSMTDFEKEKAIHDYIVNITKYDRENFEKGTTPIESHTAYGVFVNKVAVCEGYAIAMKKMLDAVDIESLIVIGEAGGYNHAWNLVNLEGEWYHVDATWDDPVYIVNEKQVDILSYDYFNLTDDEIKKTHKFNAENYPKAISKKFSLKNPSK